MFFMLGVLFFLFFKKKNLLLILIYEKYVSIKEHDLHVGFKSYKFLEN